MFFLNIISFQDILQFGFGRSQIEWNMKVKIGISNCTGLMLNGHSNPYIESTTVLSDIAYQVAKLCMYTLLLAPYSLGSRPSPSFDLPTPAQLKRARKGKAWNRG